jgi:hypothetical protein
VCFQRPSDDRWTGWHMWAVGLPGLCLGWAGWPEPGRAWNGWYLPVWNGFSQCRDAAGAAVAAGAGKKGMMPSPPQEKSVARPFTSQSP